MIIDLSHLITTDLPVYPGDPKPRINLANSIDNDGFTDHYFTLGTHTGTHIDAPAHMVSGGKNLNDYPTSRFIGRGVLVDATTTFSLQIIKKLDIHSGDIVVFKTGLSQQFGRSDYYTEPRPIPEDVARYLVSREISMVGVDTGTVDPPPFTVHKILLGGDVLIIENLTNLEQLPRDFTIIALPLNLGLDGSPCRVIASTEPIPIQHQRP